MARVEVTTPPGRLRLAIFSRYSLADQYDLIAEMPGVLDRLAASHDVLHLSLRGPKPRPTVPAAVQVDEMPLRISRGSPGDIYFKTLIMYFLLPIAVWKLRRFRPHLIFCTEVLPLYGLALKLLCGTRVTIPMGDRHLHNLFARFRLTRPLLKLAEFLERAEISRMSGIFTRGETILRRITSCPIPREKVRIVRDVPDPECFGPRDASELRRRCGFGPDDIVLNFHGIMHKAKGLDMILRWTADLHREDPRIGIILVGSGPDELELRQLARTLGLGTRAVFTGWLPTVREVGDYCNASDICLPMRVGTPDQMDMIPGALVHSLACGKVVVAPNMPGMAEMIVDGQNGYLFRPDDGEDFKRIIRRLAADRPSWEPIRRQALACVEEKYSLSAAVRAYSEAIVFFATHPE